MKLDLLKEARFFSVNDHVIKDCGKIHLEQDEMVTFTTKTNKEYDFAAKEWGFYATPSINGRLRNEGFKTALVVNEDNKLFVMVVEDDKLQVFEEYLIKNQDNRVICWLNDFFTVKK